MAKEPSLRLIAVEEAQLAEHHDGRTWRIGISGSNGGNGRVPGWENAWFYTYSACAAAIAWVEKHGGSYRLYLTWKKDKGKGEQDNGS